MSTVTFEIEGAQEVVIVCNPCDNLLELARRANVAMDAPCSGNGSCGKCRVKLLSGELESLPSRHISAEEWAEGWRLSCNCRVMADAPTAQAEQQDSTCPAPGESEERTASSTAATAMIPQRAAKTGAHFFIPAPKTSPTEKSRNLQSVSASASEIESSPPSSSGKLCESDSESPSKNEEYSFFMSSLASAQTVSVKSAASISANAANIAPLIAIR